MLILATEHRSLRRPSQQVRAVPIIVGCLHAVISMLKAFSIAFLSGCCGVFSFGEQTLLVYDIPDAPTFLPLSLSRTGQTVEKLRKIRMEGFVSGKTSSEIAANREPLVVTHSLASLWPALNWNLRNLSQTTWTTLYDVLSTPVLAARLCSQVEEDKSMSVRESIFYMHDKGHSSGSIKNSATGSRAKPPKHIHEMSLQSFLDVSDALLQLRNVTDTSKLRRYLYSTDYDELEAELNLQRDTSWRDFLINDFNCGPGSKSGAPCENVVIPSPVFTMLHPGSVLQARYSEYHTMRVQLQGRATYYLFPPHSSNFPLHVYPSVHRCARQAQVSGTLCKA